MIERWERWLRWVGLMMVVVMGWLPACGAALDTDRAPTVKNSFGMVFNLIQPGKFLMGSPERDKDRYRDEIQHPVVLSTPFYMQVTEVTQGQWQAVMGDRPSYFSRCGDDCPVEAVSWDDVQMFLAKLNAKGEGTYRLPTEAEWEYAARGGVSTLYSFGNDATEIANYSWFAKNSGSKTHPVAQLKPNGWGLYDMEGNVYEWVADWYGLYPSAEVVDPQGPTSGTFRVARGGGWHSSPARVRPAVRNIYGPTFRYYRLGFRLIKAIP